MSEIHFATGTGLLVSQVKRMKLGNRCTRRCLTKMALIKEINYSDSCKQYWVKAQEDVINRFGHQGGTGEQALKQVIKDLSYAMSFRPTMDFSHSL